MKLRVHGTKEESTSPSELALSYPGGVTVKGAATVSSARAWADEIDLDAADEDIVEIEFEDGVRLWSRAEDVRRNFAPQGARGGDGGIVDLPTTLSVGPASRAWWGGLALKAIRLLGLGDVEGTIAQFAADHVENKLVPGPGLYRCAEDDATRLMPIRTLDGSGPALIFLHGTASSTSGSFGGLWTPRGGEPIASLFEHYRGRVLAYQHRTLSESPIENAVALLRALQELLPQGSELHLVSHSRGGLVGELLARGMRLGAEPFTAADLALFSSVERLRDRRALERLNGLLMQSALRETKFVRVACPARGTTLADRRLDRYLSVLVNLAGFIPGLRASPVYEGLTSLLAGVLQKRADPEQLPGIEAMMPTSPLVRMLNDPDVTTAADLHVLGGDLAGQGVLGRLKTLATDFYYRDDHDLVVNTPAMLGGMARVAPIRYWLDTGDQVTHFHYFARPDTTRRLRRGQCARDRLRRADRCRGARGASRARDGDTAGRRPGHVGHRCAARHRDVLHGHGARRHGHRSPAFLLAMADHALLAALQTRTLSASDRGAVADAYARALSRGTTNRQRNSVRSQFTFFQALAGHLGAEGKPLVAALDALGAEVLRTDR